MHESDQLRETQTRINQLQAGTVCPTTIEYLHVLLHG